MYEPCGNAGLFLFDIQAMVRYNCIMTQVCKQSALACCPQIQALLDPRLFKALCDPTRIAILARMAQSPDPCTVSQMAHCCPVDLSVVSRHLAILREAGVVKAQKRGKEVWYQVRFTELAATLRKIADAIEHCCQTDDSANDESSGIGFQPMSREQNTGQTPVPESPEAGDLQ